MMEQDFFNLCDRQFDAAFDQIEGLARYPWVGSKFANSKCCPLIIGDSHYAVDDNGNFSSEALKEIKDKDSTRGVVNCVIKDKCKGETTWKMYEELLKIFLEISPENVKDFWSKITGFCK